MVATILIIDDNREFQKLMTLRLRSFLPDLQVVTGSTIAEARQILNARPPLQPDLLILDHHLPDGNGLSLLDEESLQGLAVLAVSSDEDPEIPGESLRAGATYFLSKARVSEPLFRPLVLGMVDRNKTQRELVELKRKETVMDTVRTLIGTLRHEINNPLGAVLGAAYILKTAEGSSPNLLEAARLVDESGRRIKHVLDELSKTVLLDEVVKARHKVFHIPGDKPWDDK
jgi:CheY-like chemotaxis protein